MGKTKTLRDSLKTEEFDDYNVEYSFAIEYDGPPVGYDIPHVVPVDVDRIPTAAAAAKASVLNSLSIPTVQPIPKSSHYNKTTLLVSENSDSLVSRRESSETMEFSDSQDDDLSGSTDVEDNEHQITGQVANPVEVDVSVSVFSGDTTSDESYLAGESIPEKPLAKNEGKTGSCYRCLKGSRLTEKEECIVCGAKYCRACLVRSMGSMPEGRKCIPCIGFRINESNRLRLGKSSKLMKKLMSDSEIEKIMNAELFCKANQLPPHLFRVNGKELSLQELVELRSCDNPPKKLKPGGYWYDKVSGLWGKEGESPCHIISPHLAVGGQLKKEASNGNTDVEINGRKITKPELRLLKFAGITCKGKPSYWVSSDGSFSEEGQKNFLGNLWTRTGTKLFCAALSLPVPPEPKNPSGDAVAVDANKNKLNNLDLYKLLLVGCDQSGTSTIYKQAKILYKVPFTEDERQNVKFVIQRNLYSYVAILLEGREKFEEDYLIELLEQPGPSEITEGVDEKNIYSISPKLKLFSDWLLQVNMSGNLEAIFPAATREYSSLIEELWKDKGFLATYRQRSALQTLPGVANYFLDRATEISKADYEPSDMDILYAEGITSSHGIASMEYIANGTSQENFRDPNDQEDSMQRRYQLIRANSRSLGENCKWLEMFEDVDVVIFCVSLSDYTEFHEDINGFRTNKMLLAKKLFENMVNRPRFAKKHFVLILNKFDLLEEKLENTPLTICDWFNDFNPVISHNPGSQNGNNHSSLAQRAFHYIAVKFKQLFKSLTGRKLYVSRVTGLESDSVDEALKYVREILKWEEEQVKTYRVTEWSYESVEASTTS